MVVEQQTDMEMPMWASRSARGSGRWYRGVGAGIHDHGYGNLCMLLGHWACGGCH